MWRLLLPRGPSARLLAASAASSPDRRAKWRQLRRRERLLSRRRRSGRRRRSRVQLFAAGAPYWLPFFRVRSFLVASIFLLFAHVLSTEFSCKPGRLKAAATARFMRVPGQLRLVRFRVLLLRLCRGAREGRVCRAPQAPQNRREPAQP